MRLFLSGGAVTLLFHPRSALDDPRHARFDRRYAGIDPARLPAAESLKDTMDRVHAVLG
jgi:bisphosphoglycerate-dependent phosphoglycerate mutase